MQRILQIAFVTMVVVSSQSLFAAPREATSIIGVFTEAAGSPKIIGAQLVVTGLATPEAMMVWPDGIDTKMKKIFENEFLVVLQSVGAVGSTDTLYVELQNKKFLVVSVGALATAVKPNSVTLASYRGYFK
jgi:hypothetical protein